VSGRKELSSQIQNLQLLHLSFGEGRNFHQQVINLLRKKERRFDITPSMCLEEGNESKEEKLGWDCEVNSAEN
jgi:hypothetical protein